MIKIIARLRAERLAWGLSVQDLAEIMGYSTRTVFYWESSERSPDLGALIKWANTLGMDIEAVRRK